MFLTNFPESKLAKKLPSCNLFAALYRVSFIRKIFSIFGSSKFLLFSERLPKKQAVFYPNTSKKEKSGPAGIKNDLILSESILVAAKSLNIKKNTITEEGETRKRLEKMEKSLLLMADQQNYIISMLKSIKDWRPEWENLPIIYIFRGIHISFYAKNVNICSKLINRKRKLIFSFFSFALIVNTLCHILESMHIWKSGRLLLLVS